MLDDTKKFSILVPVYNVEQYLNQCLESLIDQNSNSYEIVLVDDGSTDLSGEICDEYMEKYPELIRVIHKENAGLLMARRTAIKVAKGKYFIFVDSDDFVEKSMLSTFDEIIKKYNPDMIIYHLDRYDGEKYSFFRNTLYNESRLICSNEKEDYYKATLLHSISNGMCGKVVSREIVDIEKDYSHFKHVSVGEDLLQSLPIITKSERIYFLNEILYHYRINPNSVGRVADYKRYYSMCSVEKELSKYAELWNVSGKEDLVARHALVETIWGTLRALSKSGVDMHGEEFAQLLDEMKNDEFIKRQYSVIDKNQLNLLQRIVLSSLFNSNENRLITVLKLLAVIKR